LLFRQVFDRRLAQYAYLIGCQKTGDAIVVDPMRDVERYLSIAEEEGARIVAAAETHIHADFLSGLRELAERAGVEVYASDEGGDDWSYEWIRDGSYRRRLLKNGDTFAVGNIRFEAMHTPGHTPEHLVYLVTDAGGGATRPMGMLSGDFVFVGDVGRPDLLESAAGVSGAMDPSARTLYRSLVRFRDLPADLQIWPGHGSGSACGKALGAVPVSTVGYELAVNPAILAATSEDAFVSYILDGQPEPPLYFGRMKVQNKRGPAVLGELPAPRRVRDGKLAELSGATGVAVLDTRPWEEYRRRHLPGSLHAPLNSKFNTTAGSYVPDGMPIYLIIDESLVREAVVDLVHVGLDNVVGYATPDMFLEHAGRGGQVAMAGEVEAAELSERLTGEAFVLDVRTASEFGSAGRIPGAHNVAHTRLLARIGEIPKNRPAYVYCETGSRSAYAVGLLDRHGYKATNVAGGFVAWKAAGGESATG
jgi:hydroxyacylglutathione hydrolase